MFQVVCKWSFYLGHSAHLSPSLNNPWAFWFLKPLQCHFLTIDFYLHETANPPHPSLTYHKALCAYDIDDILTAVTNGNPVYVSTYFKFQWQSPSIHAGFFRLFFEYSPLCTPRFLTLLSSVCLKFWLWSAVQTSVFPVSHQLLLIVTIHWRPPIGSYKWWCVTYMKPTHVERSSPLFPRTTVHRDDRSQNPCLDEGKQKAEK